MKSIIPLTQTISTIIRDIPGWTPPDQLLSLYSLVLATAPLGGDILEVGSWCGRSTVVLAMAAQKSQVGCVQSIDLFPQKSDWYQNQDGTWSFNAEGTQAYSIQTVWDAPFTKDISPLYEKYDSILDIFIQSFKNNLVEDYVTYYKGTTKTFAERCKLYPSASHQYRLAFIDGDHSEEAVTADILYTLDHLLPNGVICFDDAFSAYDGVNNAIKNTIFASPRYLYSQQISRKFLVAFMS